MTWYAYLIIGAYVLLTCRLGPTRLVVARLANDAWSVAQLRGTWRVLATVALFACAYWGRIPWLAATLCPAALVAVELLMRPESRQVFHWTIRKIRSAKIASSSLFVAAVGILAWLYWPSDSPYAHPRLRAAEAIHEQIEENRQAVELQLVTMHGRLDSLNTSLGDEDDSLDQIHQLTGELIVLSDQIAEDYAELVRLRDKATELLRKTDAADRFREAAQIWRQYAIAESTEGFAELAETYEEVAQMWDAYAAAVERERDKPLKVEELQEVIRYVGRARLLLARLDPHIDNLPFSEAFDRQAELEKKLQAFVQRFALLRQQIRGLTLQLRNQAEDRGQPAQKPLKNPPLAPRNAVAARFPAERPLTTSVGDAPTTAAANALVKHSIQMTSTESNHKNAVTTPPVEEPRSESSKAPSRSTSPEATSHSTKNPQTPLPTPPPREPAPIEEFDETWAQSVRPLSEHRTQRPARPETRPIVTGFQRRQQAWMNEWERRRVRQLRSSGYALPSARSLAAAEARSRSEPHYYEMEASGF